MNSWLNRFQAGASNTGVRVVLASIVAMVLIAGAPCVSAQTAAQPESFSVGDAEYVLNEFAGSGDHTILWLTSGPDPDGLYAETAGKIAALGFHVVTSDILDAYLLDNSRGAMVGLPPEDLVALYNRILTDHPGRLLIMAAGRVSIPVLRAINLWQIDQSDRSAIAGTILVSPNLYVGVPEAGNVGTFYPVSEVSQVPVFVVQPRLSIRAFRLREVAEQLGKGGSPVYTGLTKKLRGGYFFNAPEVEDVDSMTEELVSTVRRASKLLLSAKPVAAAPQSYRALAVPERTNLKKGLVKVANRITPPALVSKFLNGSEATLENYRGKVVVVNFWASWCPPCLEEIPSMKTFYSDYQKAEKNMELLAVSVGETIEEVQTYLASDPLEFPIVMDSNSTNATEWKVFTFPTTFVLDQAGNIAAAAVGVVDWNTDETRAVMDGLLSE